MGSNTVVYVMLKIFIADNSILINVQDPIEGGISQKRVDLFPISDRVLLQILLTVELQSRYYYYLRKELNMRAL